MAGFEPAASWSRTTRAANCATPGCFCFPPDGVRFYVQAVRRERARIGRLRAAIALVQFDSMYYQIPWVRGASYRGLGLYAVTAANPILGRRHAVTFALCSLMLRRVRVKPIPDGMPPPSVRVGWCRIWVRAPCPACVLIFGMAPRGVRSHPFLAGVCVSRPWRAVMPRVGLGQACFSSTVSRFVRQCRREGIHT